MPGIWLMVIAIIILAIAVAALVRDEDPFKAAAESLSLKLTRSVPDLLPQLQGTINGLPIRIDVSQRGEPVVRYRVFYPDLGMALKLQRETTITRTLGQLGETDTQVGARAFDDSFRVNTSRPDALREMMTPGLRKTLEQLIERYPKIVIEDGQMTLLGDSLTPTAETIQTTTIQMAAAAHMLTERRPPPLERPATTRTPVERPPEMVVAGEPDDAPDETNEVQTEPRQDPGPTPEPVAMVAPPEPPPETSPLPAPSTGLPDGFFDDVFGANRLSFESDNRFEDQLKGRQITLTGKVKQARDQDGDVDLAVGAVTKAIVTVAQIDNDLYGQTDIDAVVYLPAGSAEQMDRGDEVTFRGTLDHVDPFMRNLFVTDAKLAT